MNSSRLAEARKVLENARARSLNDEKAARIAKQTARAAKLKLKHARKLSKLARKSFRRAEDQAETSTEVLERAQAKFEKLEKRFLKEQRKRKDQPARRSRSKPAATRAKPKRVTRVKIHRQPRPTKPRADTTVPQPPEDLTDPGTIAAPGSDSPGTDGQPPTSGM